MKKFKLLTTLMLSLIFFFSSLTFAQTNDQSQDQKNQALKKAQAYLELVEKTRSSEAKITELTKLLGLLDSAKKILVSHTSGASGAASENELNYWVEELNKTIRSNVVLSLKFSASIDKDKFYCIKNYDSVKGAMQSQIYTEKDLLTHLKTAEKKFEESVRNLPELVAMSDRLALIDLKISKIEKLIEDRKSKSFWGEVAIAADLFALYMTFLDFTYIDRVNTIWAGQTRAYNKWGGIFGIASEYSLEPWKKPVFTGEYYENGSKIFNDIPKSSYKNALWRRTFYTITSLAAATYFTMKYIKANNNPTHQDLINLVTFRNEIKSLKAEFDQQIELEKKEILDQARSAS